MLKMLMHLEQQFQRSIFAAVYGYRKMRIKARRRPEIVQKADKIKTSNK